MKHVLFVCMGNICRSPAAEGVMRALVEREGGAARVEIGSAGTIGFHAGALPDARMRASAARRGYELRSRARQVTPEDLVRYDLVITMDEENRRGVLALATSEAERGKVRRFTEFCREHDDREVPDPYYGGDAGFEHVLDLLEDGCRGVWEECRAEGAE
jgi:protein-tyrosine phosphatase